jgi:hypothetical protein
MRENHRRAVLLGALLSAALVLGVMDRGFSKVQPGAEPEPLFKTDKYSMLIHYMHEIYEHYTVAGKLVKKGDIPNAIVHLKALEYYIALIPTAIPDKDRDGKPVNKELYLKNFGDLKNFSVMVRKTLESGDYQKGKPLPPPDVVTKTCDECHKNQKIPPPW